MCLPFWNLDPVLLSYANSFIVYVAFSLELAALVYTPSIHLTPENCDIVLQQRVAPRDSPMGHPELVETLLPRHSCGPSPEAKPQRMSIPFPARRD